MGLGLPCRPPLPEKTVDDRVEVHCPPGFVDRAFIWFLTAFTTHHLLLTDDLVRSHPFLDRCPCRWRRIEGTSPGDRLAPRLSLDLTSDVRSSIGEVSSGAAKRRCKCLAASLEDRPCVPWMHGVHRCSASLGTRLGVPVSRGGVEHMPCHGLVKRERSSAKAPKALARSRLWHRDAIHPMGARRRRTGAVSPVIRAARRLLERGKWPARGRLSRCHPAW